MSDEQIVKHCSPTLAGLKTGNLFSCTCISKQELLSEIRELNTRLVPKGLQILPLRVQHGKALIYVYRPKSLRRDLTDQQAREILEVRGYHPEKMNQCIVHLIHELETAEEFPHEVGLFLGYPPEDVSGFIANHAAAHKCVGCWKVYGDEKAAQKTFDMYKKCTSIYTSQWEQGKKIERLAVAV